MKMTSGRLIMFMYAIGIILGLSKAVNSKWICYNTVCEEGIHFCNQDPYEKRCSRCEDFAERCFTKFHESNCSSYCNALRERQSEARDCASAPDIPNGSNNGSNNAYPQGTLITYTCKDGFVITGKDSIQCRAYGQWTIPPTCEGITCLVEAPENGKISTGTPNESLHPQLQVGDLVDYNHSDKQLKRRGKMNLLFGHTAKFSCDDGFKLFGTDSVVCTQQPYLKVPVCVPIEQECQYIAWQNLFGGFTGSLVLSALIFCCIYSYYRKRCIKRNKQAKYSHIKKNEDVAVDMASLTENGTSKDSGLHTPLTAKSSASSVNIDCNKENIDATPNKANDAINNINNANVNIHINSHPNGPPGITVNGEPRPETVTTFPVEETSEKKQAPSPNTDRKEVDTQPINPRPELNENDIHQPSGDDSGEKTLAYFPTSSPSAAQQSPRSFTQEQDQGIGAKLMLDSVVADLQDFGS